MRAHGREYRSVVKRAVDEVERDDTNQHQQAADCGVDEKLDGRVDSSFASPNSDQEEHRHQRSLEEKIEEQQIQRNEDANHCAFQQEQKYVV